ncbi:MAG: 16S rRNA (uracil(1498)-N(3))-methyltransferase [Pseudomonadota bacterium]|nr:16S rRNA (uracil(1498)-N(3))-methyltransferase [Pseudomonadota bacterium]
MKKHRFFEPECLNHGDSLDHSDWTLSSNSHQHLRALRVRVGDRIVLFNGGGGSYEAEVVQLKPIGVCRLVSYTPDHKPAHALSQSLVVALCQPQKMAWIVQKATELGVEDIWPVHTQYSEVRGAQFSGDKQKRYETIIQQACAQSGRNRLPTMHQPLSLEQLTLPFEQEQVACFLLHPESPYPLSITMMEKYQSLIWFVGPEGGWSVSELEYLKLKGCHQVSVAPHILRMETACVASLAMGNLMLNST